MRSEPLSTRQRGQILPMVALLAVALIGIVGLAMDVGRVMVAKAELRRAVDAAALAGALELPDMDQVETAVNSYMGQNEPEADVWPPESPAASRASRPA